MNKSNLLFKKNIRRKYPMKMNITLRYKTNMEDNITNLYTLLYSILVYDVCEIIVSSDSGRKVFKLVEIRRKINTI